MGSRTLPFFMPDGTLEYVEVLERRRIAKDPRPHKPASLGNLNDPDPWDFRMTMLVIGCALTSGALGIGLGFLIWGVRW